MDGNDVDQFDRLKERKNFFELFNLINGILIRINIPYSKLKY